MLKLEDEYPGRVETATTSYPYGTFKDKSAAGSNDGTPIADARRLKDWHGAFYAILERAGITPSGVPDTALVSDIAKALFESGAINSDSIGEVSLSKISAGSTDVENSYFTIRSSTLPSQYTNQNNFDFKAHAGNTTTNTERVTELSGWGISNSSGTAARGDSTGQTINDGLMSFDISAITWTLSGDSKYYYAIVNRDTGLKWETDGALGSIFSCYEASITGNSGSYRKKYSVDLDMIESSGKIFIQTIYKSAYIGDPTTMSDIYLHVRAMASPL